MVMADKQQCGDKEEEDAEQMDKDRSDGWRVFKYLSEARTKACSLSHQSICLGGAEARGNLVIVS